MPGMIGSSADVARYDPTRATGSDKLMMMGAMLRDMGGGLNGSGGDAILQTQGLLAQRQMLAQRNGLIDQLGNMVGGQPQSALGQTNAPQVGLNAPGAATSQSIPLTDPRWSKAALLAPMLGLDMKDFLKIQEMNQPHISVTPSGEAINDKSGRYEGMQFPGLDKGIVPNRGPNGQLLGASALPGYADAAANIAGATTGAQEQQKAAYDLVDVPLGNGAVAKLPRAIAIPLLAKSAMRLAGGGQGAQGAPGAAGDPGGVDTAGFGVTPTPAMTTLSNKRAEVQAGREQLQPKEQGAINDLKRTSDLTSQILHQVLGDAPIVDPKTGQTTGWKEGGAKPQLNWATTGFAANLKGVDGTPAHDLEQQLEHVKSMTALDELQKMRDNSPTGGAMGRVTDGMIDLLAATRGSIDQGQRGPQLTANLRRQLQQLDKLRTNREQTFQAEYGNVQQPAPIGQGGKAAAAPPKPGQVVRGYKYLGGNPADPKSWAKS